jgi:hypothetical protein
MKQDINIPEIKNVTVVVKPEDGGDHWSVHLVNGNSFVLKDILVASKGYSQKAPGSEETSIIRQFFEKLEANSSRQIELIDPEVFHLFNEYGVTYYVDKEIYFKKFVFVPDSITKENLIVNVIIGSKVVTHS